MIEVLWRLYRSRKAFVALVGAVVLIAGYFHVDLDPEFVYLGIAALLAILNAAYGMASSGVPKTVAQIPPEEKEVLDLVKKVRKDGFDPRDVVEVGRKVLAVQEPLRASTQRVREVLDEPESGKSPAMPATMLVLAFCLVPNVIFASPSINRGAFECYEESPWWRGLYETVFNASNDDAAAVGAAVGALSQWDCQPIDLNGDRVPDPNPRCAPPPGCGMSPEIIAPQCDPGDVCQPVLRQEHPASRRAVPIPDVIAPARIVETIQDRVIRLPDITVLEEYKPPAYHPNENEFGRLNCYCSRSQMAVGEEVLCTITGKPDGPPVWTTTGPLQSSTFDNGRSTAVIATEDGSGTIQFREQCSRSVYIHPRRPSLQDDLLQESIDAALDDAEADHRRSIWTNATFVGPFFTVVAAVVYALWPRDGQPAQSVQPAGVGR